MTTNHSGVSVLPTYTIFDNDTFGNVSPTVTVDPGGSSYSLVKSVLIGTVLGIVIILAILGNILVCVAVFTDRRLKQLNNLFIVSLAIADLLVATFVMTFAVINDIKDVWLFGSVFCNIWLSMDIMCSTASILNLCVISLDRYIHIRDPFRYADCMTWKKVASMITLVWVLSLIISFVPIHMEWQKNPNDRGKPPDDFSCAMDLNPVYAVVSSIISFYIPLIVMLTIYIQLYVYARKHMNSIKKMHSPSERLNSNNGKSGGSKISDHKAAVTLGVIVGVFLFCWLPFFIMNLVAALIEVPRTLFNILTWLGYVNSCLNPIIYSIFNKDFREAFRRILFPKSCCRNRHRGHGYGDNYNTRSRYQTEYITHSEENGTKKDCKEPLYTEMANL